MKDSDKTLCKFVSLLEIIRIIYNHINEHDTSETFKMIEDFPVTNCSGVGARLYKYSLTITYNSWGHGIHDAEIILYSVDNEVLTTINIRIETNLKEIYINVQWDAFDWMAILKECLDSFFLDYLINLHVRENNNRL